jgi:hypothetical protein
VAIIKAIQTLGQATLDEVIEKLRELRDGGGMRPPAPSAQRVAAGADRGHEGSHPQNTGAIAPGYKSEASRVQETVANVEPEKVWEQVIAKIPAKGFLRTLIESIRPIGIEGRNFLLGHSPDDKPKIEALASANNRRQLEMLLKEATGRDWSVKFMAREGIVPRGPASSDSEKTAESFKDDPLIQEALEMFNAQIKS